MTGPSLRGTLHSKGCELHWNASTSGRSETLSWADRRLGGFEKRVARITKMMCKCIVVILILAVALCPPVASAYTVTFDEVPAPGTAGPCFYPAVTDSL